MSISPALTCQELVGEWARRPCGRPVKADGLCGIHLAAKTRRAANDVKRAEARAAERKRRATAERVAEHLAACGIPDVRAHDYGGDYTGGIVIPPEQLDRLLELVRAGAEATR
jgi:hypothetical protein